MLELYSTNFGTLLISTLVLIVSEPLHFCIPAVNSTYGKINKEGS